MKIDAVVAKFPSKIMSNADILELIKNNSEAIYKGNLKLFLKGFAKLLKAVGSDKRYALAPGETLLQLIEQAFDEAINKAAWDRNELDLIIYTGVGRPVIEPGNSYVLAQALGLTKVHCFDISDACMSWGRALFIADQFLKNKIYKKIAIINAEFNALEQHQNSSGVQEPLSYSSKAEAEWKFPSATIGEATTVTLLSTDDANVFEYHFTSHPEFADLCTIPCQGYQGYINAQQRERIGKNGILKFTSFGYQLHEQASKPIINIFKQLSIPHGDIDIIFVHASSSKTWEKGSQGIGISEKIYHIFPETGNIVSASIPGAMYKAEKVGKFKRGDRVVACIGSAGMSFAAISFIY